jgi:hypothetical protein
MDALAEESFFQKLGSVLAVSLIAAEISMAMNFFNVKTKS